MKRLRYCVICEKELEPGGRVDKKYCGAGCTQAAYRQRHPEKHRHAADRVNPRRALTEPGDYAGSSLANSVAKLEEENAALRREQAALKSRLVHLERDTSLQAFQSISVERTQARLNAAERTIADLRRSITEWSERAENAEESLAVANGQLAEQKESEQHWRNVADEQARKLSQQRSVTTKLEQALSDANERLAELNESERTLRNRFDEQQRQLNQANESRKVAEQRASKLAQERAEPTRQPVFSSATNAALVPMNPHKAERPEIQVTLTRKKLPWEVPSKADPSVLMPFWSRVNSEGIRWTEEQGREALDRIPSQLYRKGERTKSGGMREWLDANQPLVTKLSEELAKRIICTAHTERKGKQQKATLATLALHDVLDELKRNQPAEADKQAAHAKKWANHYNLLATELVDALSGYYFKPSR